MKQNQKLTSIKLTEDLYGQYKQACLDNNFSLKKLVERSIFLYLTDNDYRNRIHKQDNINLK